MKHRNSKEISIIVEDIVCKINNKFPHKRISYTPTKGDDKLTTTELEKRRKKTLSMLKKRDLYILSLCRDKNISYDFIKKLGDFVIPEYLQPEDKV